VLCSLERGFTAFFSGQRYAALSARYGQVAKLIAPVSQSASEVTALI
jgi:hypothetical protein